MPENTLLATSVFELYIMSPAKCRKVPTSHLVKMTLPRPNQRGHPCKRVNPRCTKRALRQNSASTLIRLHSINMF